MKKLFIIPLLSAAVSLSLVSCLEMGKGGNKEEGSLLAVVGYSTKVMAPTMLTIAGEFAAPSLASENLYRGDCIWAHFTLDWDNQPNSEPPYYATEISYVTIDQSEAEIPTNFDEKELYIPAENILPIQSLAIQSYNPILNGKVFFGFSHNAPTKQDMGYTLFVKPNENASSDPITVYIIGEKKNKPEGASSTIETIYAFDMLGAIATLGEETTIRENSVEYRVKQMKIKIKYCTGVDSNNAPTYQDYNSGNTITLSIYTN
ncbi:hypothetical protein FACS1894182_01410 [Bacteroidia bacterium]|nr:hypothetical protein FACS1894182_01410 [Bacteroidia bacterium]